jgi:hypothetical protein
MIIIVTTMSRDSDWAYLLSGLSIGYWLGLVQFNAP